MAKQGFNIAPAVCDAKNQHVLVLDPINYKVLAHRKTPRANAKVVSTGTAQLRDGWRAEKNGW